MTVTKIWHFGESTAIDVTKKQGSSELDKATRTIVRIGNIVNHGRLSAEAGSTSTASILNSTAGDDPAYSKSRWVGQPTDVALLDLIDKFSEDDVRNRIGTRKHETPFSSERKWMGVVIQGSTGSNVAYIKGALERVLQKCDTYITTDGREIVLDDARRKEALAAADSMAIEGLRVLGFASGSVREPKHAPIATTRSGRTTPKVVPGASPNKPDFGNDEEVYQGLAFAGLVGMNDPPKRC